MSVRSPLRAARLVVWGNAYLLGRSSLDLAGDQASGIDGRHRVHGLQDGLAPEPVSMTVALGLLSRTGVRGLRLALPVPGDVSGLPGPEDFNSAALGAGEAALCDGVALGLVPTNGPGQVSWMVLPTSGHQPTMAGLAEAGRALAMAIRQATGALDALDVAGAGPGVEESLERIRGAGEPLRLPAPYPHRAQALLDQALRIEAILELAASQDGSAHSAGAMAARRRELGQLAVAARAAVVASCNAAVEAVTHGTPPVVSSGPDSLADP